MKKVLSLIFWILIYYGNGSSSASNYSLKHSLVLKINNRCLILLAHYTQVESPLWTKKNAPFWRACQLNYFDYNWCTFNYLYWIVFGIWLRYAWDITISFVGYGRAEHGLRLIQTWSSNYLATVLVTYANKQLLILYLLDILRLEYDHDKWITQNV